MTTRNHPMPAVGPNVRLQDQQNVCRFENHQSLGIIGQPALKHDSDLKHGLASNWYIS